jgi:hypothetical protein
LKTSKIDDLLNFFTVQNINQTYLELLDEFEELQSKCTRDINHQRYRIAQLAKNLK